MEDTSQITWIVLNAVKNMQIGVDKLALFLKGSKSKLVVPIETYRKKSVVYDALKHQKKILQWV